jgi:aryl-alcohol dehydrogenase-like predicted oxidoreductase
MTTETAELGRSGLEISGLGLGTWAFGGSDWASSWGPQSDDTSVSVIHRAVEQGINWIDTAPGYGIGHAEEVVGRALSEMHERERPLVFTKCGVVWNLDDRMEWPKLIASPQVIRTEIVDSLRRLRTDCIDLYQVHWPSQDGTPYEDTWATMLELKQEGKARAIGVSNYGIDALEATIATGSIDSLQLPFSLIRREAAGDLIPWCVERGVGVLAYSPLQSGLLSGAMTEKRLQSLDPADWRRTGPEFNGDSGRRNFALGEKVGDLARRLGVAPAAVAVAWTRAWRGLTGVIVGARSESQLDGWVVAGDLELSAENLEELAAAVRSTGAGVGPDLP